MVIYTILLRGVQGQQSKSNNKGMGGGLVLIQGKSRILEDYRKKTYTSKEKDEQISN